MKKILFLHGFFATGSCHMANALREAFWVRPEKMFFGKVTRNGRTFNRFTEIDK